MGRVGEVASRVGGAQQSQGLPDADQSPALLILLLWLPKVIFSPCSDLPSNPVVLITSGSS